MDCCTRKFRPSGFYYYRWTVQKLIQYKSIYFFDQRNWAPTVMRAIQFVMNLGKNKKKEFTLSLIKSEKVSKKQQTINCRNYRGREINLIHRSYLKDCTLLNWCLYLISEEFLIILPWKFNGVFYCWYTWSSNLQMFSLQWVPNYSFSRTFPRK